MMRELILSQALEAGKCVICDRFVTSTLAYQLGGDGLTAEEIRGVGQVAIGGRWPDLTILLDMPVEMSFQRMKRDRDRIEQRPMEYHQRVRENYLSQAKHDPKRIRVIAADRTPEAVHADVVKILESLVAMIRLGGYFRAGWGGCFVASGGGFRDRLPHGLIFAGPEGVGKATTAAGLAGFFLCEKPGDGDACGKCARSCAAMGSGNHPDYHVITKELARVRDKSGTSKATQLPINVIRYDLAEPAGRKTVMGRGKFFVVEQAELMTDAAQNALLKTLEEPAGRCLIVLLTTHANELLATIRSRCQVIRFGAFAAPLVVKQLQRRGIDGSTAEVAAEFSDGSLGVALRWIEDGILAHATGVAEAMDLILAGREAELADLLRKGADAYAAKALERDELASKDSAVRSGLGVYLAFAVRRIRQKMRSTGDEDFLDRACDAVDAIGRAEKYLGANVNVSLVLEQLGGAIQGEPQRR